MGYPFEIPLFLLATFAGAVVAGPFRLCLRPRRRVAVALHPDAAANARRLIVAFGLIVQGYSVWKLRRALDWRKLWPFVLGAALGVPVGVTLLDMVRSAQHPCRRSAFSSCFTASMRVSVPALKPVTVGRRCSRCCGRLRSTACLAGLTGLAGILVTIWSGLRGWPKDVQRAVFQPVAVAIFLMSALWLGAKGTVTAETGTLLALGRDQFLWRPATARSSGRSQQPRVGTRRAGRLSTSHAGRPRSSQGCRQAQ